MRGTYIWITRETLLRAQETLSTSIVFGALQAPDGATNCQACINAIQHQVTEPRESAVRTLGGCCEEHRWRYCKETRAENNAIAAELK